MMNESEMVIDKIFHYKAMSRYWLYRHCGGSNVYTIRVVGYFVVLLIAMSLLSSLRVESLIYATNRSNYGINYTGPRIGELSRDPKVAAAAVAAIRAANLTGTDPVDQIKLTEAEPVRYHNWNSEYLVITLGILKVRTCLHNLQCKCCESSLANGY